MSTAKIQIGPQVDLNVPTPHRHWVLVAAFGLLLGLQVGTQRFAADFQYRPKLGLNFYHLYPPYDLVWWWAQYHSDYPHEFMRAASLALVFGALGLLLALFGRMIVANTARFNPHLHGSARWATLKDIVAAGLIVMSHWRTPWRRKQGSHRPCLYIGSWIDQRGAQHYLIDSSNMHVLLYAPTRSGKGVSIVVPSLLAWRESALILDLKDELWALTSGWRQKHANNKVLRFEPAAMTNTVAWNPLDEIRLGTEYETGDTQNLATLIVDPDGGGLESHWQKTSMPLLVGVILHALYKRKHEGLAANLPVVDRMLSDPTRSEQELWMEMATYSHINGKNHPAVGQAAADMMRRPEEEAGSVLSTAKSFLSLYRDPIVARNVSSSDFCINDLMNHENPVSLYLVTQYVDQVRLRPLVRVFVNMAVRVSGKKLVFKQGRSVKQYQHELLFMLDEFPQLGRLEIIQESLAFVATYGLKFFIVCQDLNQLKREKLGYGRDETITSNCHIQAAFPPNRIETAEHLSKLTGQTTVEKAHITTSGRRASPLLGGVSRTIQEVQRPLLTPDECMRIPAAQKDDGARIIKAGDMLVCVAGYPAIYGRQPLYFQDPIFSQRAAIDAPLTSDVLRPKKPLVAPVSI
jgi:type IV secretion system protein VirD4